MGKNKRWRAAPSITIAKYYASAFNTNNQIAHTLCGPYDNTSTGVVAVLRHSH